MDDNYARCAVRTCPNNSKKSKNKIRYFRFPRDEDLLTLWTVRCDRVDTWTPSSSFICSAHFTADDYLEVTPGISRLHPEAVPSRNLGYDWDGEDQADVMMMEEDFTSEDDDNNDSIVRALMSMRNRPRTSKVPATSAANFPMTEISPPVPTYPTTSTQSDSDQVMPNRTSDDVRTKDPNLIVITDIRKKYKPLKQVDPSTVASLSMPRKPKRLFCCVPTCSARKGKDKDMRNGFHYLPKDPNERKRWVRAIFHDSLYCKRSRFICRRHFTTDDYLDPPNSGAPARLRRGAIPTQNLPICAAESMLARKKLWMDIMRRKPEDQNLTFLEQLAREPELQLLLKRYAEEVSQIDPERANVIPHIPRRGELRGSGNPVQGTGRIPEKKKNSKKRKSLEEMTGEERMEYLANKAMKKEESQRKQRIRAQHRALRQKQLSEERKMKLFEEKLERLELRKSNPDAYHQLLAEERAMQRKEELAKRTNSLHKAQKARVSAVDKERLELRMSDPEAYDQLVTKDLEVERKQKLAQRITGAAHIRNPISFSDKIEIIAKDPEKGGKYKVVVKKVLKRRGDIQKDMVSQLARNQVKSMEIVQNVIKEIDFTKSKRVKFPETEKLTKISQLRALGIDVQGFELGKDSQVKIVAPSSAAVEPMITGDDFETDDVQGLAEDHHSDDDHFGDGHHSDENPFEELSCNENILDDMADGYDHSYTNKTSLLNEQGPGAQDPFEELRSRLMSMPEDEARALVKEKMDGYKETFQKQMTKMRAVLQTKKKIDRKVKMLTRALCLSLREQYVKYYKN